MKYVFALLSVLIASAAQVFMKKASFDRFGEPKWLFFMFLALCSYGVAFLLQSYVLKIFPFSKIAPVTGIAIVLLTFFSGMLFFGEVPELKQIIGIFLGLISIYLILM